MFLLSEESNSKFKKLIRKITDSIIKKILFMYLFIKRFNLNFFSKSKKNINLHENIPKIKINKFWKKRKVDVINFFYFKQN